MSLPEIVTREEWLAARTDLLVREKDHTRQRDALNADRRRLPMVEISKTYTFEGPDGTVALADLFDGRAQLIIQHVMFDPAWDAACPGCTAGLDELAPGMMQHLASRDTSFAGISRAPYDKLAAYQAAHGWDFGWYSSYGTDFNYDFDATLDAAVKPAVYNYRAQPDGADRRRGRGAGPQLLPARRRSHLPHLLDLGQRHGSAGQLLLAAGPDGVRPVRGVGGAEGPGSQAARRRSDLHRLARLTC